MRTGLVLGLLLVLAVVARPAPVGAQSGAPSSASETARPTSFVKFYGHVFGVGLGSPMPSNTQFPAGEDNLGLGGDTACSDTAAAVAPDGDCQSDPNNKVALYSTPGFVQIANFNEFNRKGGYAALHNEHGSTKDIVLDTSQHIKATVYTSVDFHSWFVGQGDTVCVTGDPPEDVACPYPDWGWDPGTMVDSQVKATLYYAILGSYGAAAGEKPDIQGALAGGKATMVAQGLVGPKQVSNGLPGSPNQIKWDIDLGTPKVSLIPKEANFFLVFQMDNSNAWGEYSTVNSYRFWAGEYFPPSYTLPVKNAFDVEQVIPTFVYGKLAIIGVINTPWGSYDIDPAATRLTVTNAQGTQVTPEHVDVLADYSVAHGAHYKPVNVTFVWDYAADRLRAGTYTATIFAQNHEGSASAQCTATFTIQPDGTPGAANAGICGEQTANKFLNESGVMKMGKGSDAEASGTPGAPAPPPASPLAVFADAVGRLL
ncbi:MAG: hypothetical protein ACYDCK_04460 [Thermoplasmatota archaeon]